MRKTPAITMQKTINNKIRLPIAVKNVLKRCPQSGDGVHPWIFSAACKLKLHVSGQTAFDLISAHSAGCGRPVYPREIWDAIHSASNSKPDAGEPKLNPPKVNHEQVEAITVNGGGLADLWEASPMRFEDDVPKTELLIDLLFPGNPLLCVGHAIDRFDTKPREAWRGKLTDMQFIVPHPMTSERGIAKSGKSGARTNDNTGPRQHIVIEFDNGSFDEHASILHHLAKHAPMVMALMSGNKSLHAWFGAWDTPEDLQLRFMRYAVSLGADRALWTKSQMVRLPDGWRPDKSARQSVIYFNPENLKH
jgi:hypothetical protein